MATLDDDDLIAISNVVATQLAAYGVSTYGGDTVDANLISVNGNTNVAVNMSAQMLAQFNGIVSSDSTTTTTTFSANVASSPGLSTVTGKHVNSLVAFYTGDVKPLARKIIGYTYADGVGTFTIEPPLDAPPATDGSVSFIVLGYAPLENSPMIIRL